MSSSPAAIVARLLLPDDANPAGNVHGGTILKMMEEAGMIAATRHMASSQASKDSEGNCIAALVRFETMAFHKPVFVGEVATCHCSIIFTSNKSILIEVVVSAEDISKGKTLLTNTGLLWYVPLIPGGGPGEEKDWTSPEVAQVPPIEPKGEEAVQKFKKAKVGYEERKRRQQGEDFTAAGDKCTDRDGGLDDFKSQYVAPSDGRSPAESEQVLCQMVLPGDCGRGSVAFGGFVMKLMDNAAGCSAFRHCRTNVVTVAIQSMDFVSWVRLGDLCTIRSKVVFASSKSLEIEVVASVTLAASGGTNDKDMVVAKGLFTFVSIGSDGKALAVPKLRLETDEDMQYAYLGQQRYESAKRARLEGRK